MPITKYIKGDLLEAEADYIAHGVNCQGVMGSGVAKVIKTEFPEVYSKYKTYTKCFASQVLIGDCLLVDAPTSKFKGIINLFTQEFYGKDGKRYVSYKAIIDSFTKLNIQCNENIVAIPKIGAGLGGGDWDIIKELIDDSTPNVEIHVYEL